jgi:hypothetical protein
LYVRLPLEDLVICHRYRASRLPEINCVTSLGQSFISSPSARTGVDCYVEVRIALVKLSRANSMSCAVFSWISSLMSVPNLSRKRFQSVRLLDRDGSVCLGDERCEIRREV